MRLSVNTVLLLVFVILRTVFDTWMRTQNLAVAYGIECALALCFIAANFKYVQFRFALHPWYWRHVGYSAILGTAIAAFAAFSGAAIPFDLSSASLWLQLVIIAPILEEALFRLLTWESLKPYLRNPRWLTLVTAALFALSHMAALTYVPETFRMFVIYQSCYTFGLGAYWGLARQRTGSWTAPVVLHFVLNLCFGLTLFLISKYQLAPMSVEIIKPRVLIVDMPANDLADRQKQRTGAPIFTIISPEDDAATSNPVPNCQVATKNANRFFEAQKVGGAVDLSDSEINDIQNLVNRSHGYHVLGIVQGGLTETEIYTLGMHGAAGASGITDPEAYIKINVQNDFKRVWQAVEELKPKMVLVATSETIEENFGDLKAAGFSDTDTKRYADRIFSAWASEWNHLLDSFPDTIFVVPTGNGSVDGVGDNIEETNVVPASFLKPNLVKVASTDGSCLSKFSNFHPTLADVASPGELVASWSACEDSPVLKLSGTSQAAAIFANRALRALEHGIAIDDFLRSHINPSPPCLGGKVLRGVVD